MARDRRGWYRITNAAAGPARVDIYDEIGADGWGGGVPAAAFVADLAAVKGDVEVHINSPGGSVFDGLAIYNALASRRGNVTTVIDGLAASAASFIAQAGKSRVISPGAMVMIHDAQGVAVGDAATMRETADLLDKASGNLAGIYAAHTGRPAEGWREAMRAESWYTADEAVAAGLADRVAERPAPAEAAKIAARWAAELRNAAPMHEPVTGTHSHAGPGGQAAREHSHDGDASHRGVYDPDGDGDDDSSAAGDTDHDYVRPDGKPGPKALSAADIQAIAAEVARILNEKYSADDRKRMAGNGHAMEDGSYPIEDAEDLDNAIHAVGRGGADHDAIRKHIIKRAQALGLSSRIPDNWNSDGSLKGTTSQAGGLPAWIAALPDATKEAAGR